MSTAVFMDTAVTIEVGVPPSAGSAKHLAEAFGWFQEVEERCSRFDPGSELSRLSATCQTSMPVSSLLFRAIEFAVAVARETDGAFDPAVGRLMERNGFDRNYRTEERVGADNESMGHASHDDVLLDGANQTVTLLRPLVLDLGAVAKGLAIDLAARALADVESLAINAGGDVYTRGFNADGAPWRIGIRHPRTPGALIATLAASGLAVCTSGDYERRQPGQPAVHDIIEPRSGRNPRETASATVVAPTAMAADALATASFVLGPAGGLALLERLGVEGLIVSRSLERFTTAGMDRYLA